MVYLNRSHFKQRDLDEKSSVILTHGGGVTAKDDQISNAYLEVPKIRITAKELEIPFYFLSTIGMSIIPTPEIFTLVHQRIFLW